MKDVTGKVCKEMTVFSLDGSLCSREKRVRTESREVSQECVENCILGGEWWWVVEDTDIVIGVKINPEGFLGKLNVRKIKKIPRCWRVWSSMLTGILFGTLARNWPCGMEIQNSPWGVFSLGAHSQPQRRYWGGTQYRSWKYKSGNHKHLKYRIGSQVKKCLKVQGAVNLPVFGEAKHS